MTKKRVASWIVTGVLVAGAGAALAEENDPVLTDETVPTTVVDESTTTTVDATTTTVDATTTTVESTTTTAVEDEGDVEGDAVGGGNSEAAQNHDCDEAWGNHGAWVAANAHAMKTGDAVSCDGPTTTVAAAADATSDVEGPARGHGHGKGSGKKQK